MPKPCAPPCVITKFLNVTVVADPVMKKSGSGSSNPSTVAVVLAMSVRSLLIWMNVPKQVPDTTIVSPELAALTAEARSEYEVGPSLALQVAALALDAVTASVPPTRPTVARIEQKRRSVRFPPEGSTGRSPFVLDGPITDDDTTGSDVNV